MVKFISQSLSPQSRRLLTTSSLVIATGLIGAISANAAPVVSTQSQVNPSPSANYVQLAQLSAGDRAKGINQSSQRHERSSRRREDTSRRRPDTRRPDTDRRPDRVRRDDRSDRRRDERRDQWSDRRRRDWIRDRNRDWRRDYRITHRRPHNGRGYSNNYRSHLGINFIFGNSGLSNYRWSRSRHDLYRPRYGSFHRYKARTHCQRIIVEANRFGYRVPVSVLECHNPWNGYYIVQGSEQRLHDYYGHW